MEARERERRDGGRKRERKETEKRTEGESTFPLEEKITILKQTPWGEERKRRRE